MASITTPGTGIPANGGSITSAIFANLFNAILAFTNDAANLDEGNADLTSSDGLVGKSTAQTITGQKTFNNIIFISTQYKSLKQSVFNNTGGTLTAGTLTYVSAYNVTQGLYEVSKAVVTTASSSTHYATGVIDSDIADQATGNICKTYPLGSLNTNALVQDQSIWLSETAGAYVTAYTSHANADSRKQIVGRVAKVHLTLGVIIFELPGTIVSWQNVSDI